MKNITNKMVMALIALILTACGSGGGEGGGGGGDTTGSAVIQNFSTGGAVATNYCSKTVPTTQTSCEAAGFNWTAPTGTTEAGIVDYGLYEAVCPVGKNLKSRCSISGVEFSPKGHPSLSLTAINDCEDAGGTIVVYCTTGIDEGKGSCDADPTDSSDCAALGGTFSSSSSLKQATGTVTGEKLYSGKNTVVQVVTSGSDGHDVTAQNPQNPVYFSFNLDMPSWQATVIRNTGTNFGDSEGYATFNFISPIGADESGTIVITTGTLYFE